MISFLRRLLNTMFCCSCIRVKDDGDLLDSLPPISQKSAPACIEMVDTCQSRGYIMCILGPMFSGKTTELLRLHERHQRAGKKGLLVKYAGDTRYDKECVATHDKKFGGGATVSAAVLEEIRDRLFAQDIDVVSIDEGQFFDDLATIVKELAHKKKIVYVAALNGTFAKEPFEQVSLLLPHVDDLSLLRAVCSCGLDAPFTFRFDNNQKVVVIGGEDAYRAVCRMCYDRALREKETR